MEEAPATAPAEERESAVEVFRDVAGDPAYRTVVDLAAAGGGGQSDGGAEHGGETIGVFSDVRALGLEEDGVSDGLSEALREEDRVREFFLNPLLVGRRSRRPRHGT